MKRIISAVLCLAMLFSFASCSKKAETTTTEPTTALSFEKNKYLSEVWNSMSEAKSELENLQKKYSKNSYSLRVNLEKICKVKDAVNISCSADEFTVILGIYNKFCENAQLLLQQMDLYELEQGELTDEYISALLLNISDYEKTYLGK